MDDVNNASKETQKMFVQNVEWKMPDESFVSYCGLDCGDCLNYTGSIS